MNESDILFGLGLFVFLIAFWLGVYDIFSSADQPLNWWGLSVDIGIGLLGIACLVTSRALGKLGKKLVGKQDSK